MNGTMQKEKAGYCWMRIGFAPSGFSTLARLVVLSALIALAIRFYVELPDTQWRWAIFLCVYLASAILYLNLGVWLHEQLHSMGLTGTKYAKQAHIKYERKHILFLGGYYTVKGGMSRQAASRALLGPLWLSGALLLIGILGNLLLPGWWLPLFLSLVTVSLLDMLHDFYMYFQIRLIGDTAKYWDRGSVIEAVWRA